MRDKLRVYVAGPYSQGDTIINIHNALKAGNDLWKAGYTPYIPHCTYAWHMLFPTPYEKWLELDLQWLAVCHVLVRIPGLSSGADGEVRFALDNSIPVYYGVHEFLNAQEELDALSGR